MKLTKLFATAAVLTAVAAPAFAADQAWHSYRFWDWNGAYVSAKGGWDWATDEHFQDGVKTNMDSDYLVTGAVGYQAAPGFRGEFEVGYFKNDLDSVKTSGAGTVGADGEAKTLTLMANTYYDLNLAQLGLAPAYANFFTPYVGAGAGAAHVHFDDYAPALAGASNNDEDWVFAYQAIAGVAFNFTPALSTTVEYRFFDTTNAEFHGAGTRLKNDQLLAGVKFKY